MEIFLLIVLLVMIGILLSKVSAQKDLTTDLKQHLRSLEKEIVQLKDKFVPAPAQDSNIPQTVQPETEATVPPSPVSIIEEPITPALTIIPEPVAEAESSVVDFPPVEWESAPAPRVHAAVQHAEERPGFFSNWLAKNPDIEKFIGENLINKIGIAILVLGIAFFVKYAIDQDWINEIGRVCIGLLCGGILIALAHKLSKNYRSFSSVLAGGGLAVFYFTIAFAFHQYHLFSQTVAFVIMVVITVFAVILSILYNRLELAVIATIGGFITPLLVSTGHGNYIVLFTYIAILNAGLIVLANYKQWRPLNFIAFFFTVILYAGWLINESSSTLPRVGAFIFASIFYCMFIVMTLIYHVAKKGRLHAFDFIMLLSINLAYYAAGMYLLAGKTSTSEYKGLFTAGLGLINLALSYAIFKRQNADRNFIYLLIGITLSFISLAAPVQLKGNYITLFWSAEIVVLYWLHQRSAIPLFKIASAIITVLTIISLVMDWMNVYGSGRIVPVITNKAFITGTVVASALFIVFLLLRKQIDTFYIRPVTNKTAQLFYVTAASIIVFLAGLFEVVDQYTQRYPDVSLTSIYVPLYIFAFAVVLYILFRRFNISTSNTLRIVVPGVLLFIYLFNIPGVYDLEKTSLTANQHKIHFVAHIISVVFLCLIINNLIRHISADQEPYKKSMRAITWVITLAIILVLSIEMQHLYVWLYYRGPGSIDVAERIFAKAGLSILLGISSFIIIWLGFRHHNKTLRVIALSIFGVTILKLFVNDLSNISPGGKIAAFILLGILLLSVSFMYQRLKKIILDDRPTENEV
ncbi:DUF2339 domain-containing protein [Danxiaibacter flavus]|uniref:DUF2339 domain-containing protein n=1 Tax=Danxiaibacter flavus TaxID=3049108 RepID=A0ABV3ZN87_9BACT|nr:DUF2339 domain-containing protein [Chitinophagaceae bacterium DXS]